MINIIQYRKALEESKERTKSVALCGMGLITPKNEGYYIYPYEVMKEYHRYQQWIKTFRPKLP